MRQQLTSQKREELRRSRDHWKARAEDEERFQKIKEEAWRLFERQSWIQMKDECAVLQCNAMQCNAMQCNAMQCNAMQALFHSNFESTRAIQ